MGVLPEQDLDVVGLGALNVDYIVSGPTDVRYFDDLERGEEHHEEDFSMLQESIENLRAVHPKLTVQLGGSALNTLRALSSLDPELRLGFVTIAGGTPETLPPETNLEELGSSVDLMINWEGGPPGTCVSVVNDAERTLMTYNNDVAVHALSDPKRRTALLANLLRARLVHVTSFFGPQAPAAVATLLKELRARRGTDVVVSVDVGHVWAGKHRARDVLRYADIVFLNQAELGLLTPAPASHEPLDQEESRAQRILDQLSPGAQRVVVLKKKELAGRGPDYIGRAGAAMYLRTGPTGPVKRYEVMREALTPAQVVDSTGAGDAFSAGVLAGLYSPQVEAIRILQLAFSAARHKMERPGIEGYTKLDQLMRGRALPPGLGQVFISHARKDRRLVDALEQFLHAGSPVARESQFFCSTLVKQGLHPSRRLRQSIWDSIRAAEFAIFVVTEDFLESRECAYELGAAAALGIRSIPLLADGVTFDNAMIPVSDSAGGRLGNRQGLAAVHAELCDVFGYDHVDNQVFEGLLSDVVREAEKSVVARREPGPEQDFPFGLARPARSAKRKKPPATKKLPAAGVAVPKVPKKTTRQ
jgi:sugar/nucleoside kinase (ribokinase family)